MYNLTGNKHPGSTVAVWNTSQYHVQTGNLMPDSYTWEGHTNNKSDWIKRFRLSDNGGDDWNSTNTAQKHCFYDWAINDAGRIPTAGLFFSSGLYNGKDIKIRLS